MNSHQKNMNAAANKERPIHKPKRMITGEIINARKISR